jgi:hypothetical protein
MGDAQGGIQRSVLNSLLWGEPPDFGGVGGTIPAPASPLGGMRKGDQIPSFFLSFIFLVPISAVRYPRPKPA